MGYVLRFLLFFIGLSVVGTANAQLNDYKYIVVPKKFGAFKNENQHQTSTLVKYLFVQKGYNVTYEGDYPEDLKEDFCSALWVDLIDNSSLFRTKTILTLRDCELNKVFSTIEGSSKQKEFKVAYNEAIRQAFTSFDRISYKYTPKQKTSSEAPITVSFKNDVKPVEVEPKAGSVEQQATIEEQRFKSSEPVISQMTKNNAEGLQSDIPNKSIQSVDMLYARPLKNGYQLVDATANIKYMLNETSVSNVFLVNQEGINGLVFKKEGKWFLEYTSSEKGRIIQELQVKF
ncbi:MAG: hypothetical protein AAGB24_08895 [Bacteroidota bacterium]